MTSTGAGHPRGAAGQANGLKPLVLAPGEGRVVAMPEGPMTIKAVGAQTGQTFALFEQHVLPGAGIPPHSHRREDEAYYVLEGEFVLSAGDQTVRARPGTFALLSRGVVHGLRNVGGAPGRFLILATPAGIEHFFERVPEAYLEREKFEALCAEHDIQLAAPLGEAGADGHDPIVVAPGGGKIIPGGNHWFATKALGTETQGLFAATEVTTPPGGGPPPHVHRLEDEAYYILEGEFLVLSGHQVVRATPGTFIFLPRGIVHAFRNVGTAPGRFLDIVTPAGFEQFYQQTSQSPPEERQDMIQLVAAAKSYGVELVAPPDDWNIG